MSTVGLALILSESSHQAPFGHPEHFGRLALLPTALDLPEIKALIEPLKLRTYELDWLKRVHTAEYVDRLNGYSDTETAYVDADTFQGPGSFQASCDVTWALLSAIDESYGAGPKVSFVVGRPPGHHALPDRGMGFCLINHAAVAAQYALDVHHCRRVAVVDFDIHHGNGTQHMFYDRNDVLYVSTHQFPFFPGTGTVGEQGIGVGLGYTANFPFWAGAGNTELVNTFETDISGILERFEPDVIIVSAGFDGHYLDPLGGFKMTGEGFRRIGVCLRQAADRLCGSRLVSVLEGGYDAQANIDSITNYLKGIALV